MSNIGIQVNALIKRAVDAAGCDEAMRFSQAALNASHAHQVLESVPDDTEALIKHMADRFLGWKLPSGFHPDCGITFDKTKIHATSWPTGTNLIGYTEAAAMVRYMLDGRS